MKTIGLRQRLLLVLLGSGALLVLAAGGAREWLARRSAEQALRAALEARLDTLDRARCESGWLAFGPGPGPGGMFGPPPGGEGFRPMGSMPAPPAGLAPGTYPGASRPRGPRHGPHRRPPFEWRAYALDFTATTPGPPLPPSVRAALEAGSGFAVAAGEQEPRTLVGVMPTPWASGPCSWVALTLPSPPALVPAMAFGAVAFALLLALGGVVTLAAGSTVARIRALAREVEAAAGRQYETGVTVSGDDEIGELAVAFNQARAVVRARLEEVEQRERALRSFVASTTHDVGVPLSALAGHLMDLRERAGAGGAADVKRLDAAAQEAHYIGSLLHNLGAAARLETGEALGQAAAVDLAALVERVALRHAVLARAAGVELNHAVPEAPDGGLGAEELRSRRSPHGNGEGFNPAPEPDGALAAEEPVRDGAPKEPATGSTRRQNPTILGDVTLLEQAVNNLVHNAIRYNRPGGHVALVLEVTGTSFALRVSDDGPGVPPTELPRLAESRFRGGDARTRRPEGSGLGLAIASEAAALHGFTLTLRNAPGGGFEAVLAGATEV